MGSATAWALRERGADVVVYEQFDSVDHERGSSHGRTRIYRLAYPDVQWVRLMEEALDGWRDLGGDVLSRHGLVELAPTRELLSSTALDSRGAEWTYDVPDPRVRVPDGWSALWQPEAGVVHADRARRAFLDGIDVRTGVRVASPDDLEADVVVLTVGGWIRQFFPDVPVRPTRETIAYFRHDGAPLPSVVELNEHSRHAMYALHDPVHGLKVGAHFAGHETDPDTEEGPSEQLVAQIAEWTAEHFPGVDATPVGAQSCIYTSTSDESFVLERRGDVVIGSPCSGHGFKFAPAIGRRLAELALT
jgi:sarcosine oxidase